MKKCISLIIALLIVISCLPITASASNLTFYSEKLVLFTSEMPQYLSGWLNFDPIYCDFLGEYQGYGPDGFIFPLASEDYDYMYEVNYELTNTCLSFEYTLKPGYDTDDFLDCLDRVLYAENGGLARRGVNAYNSFTVFDSALSITKNNSQGAVASVQIRDLTNTDGKVIYKNGVKKANNSISAKSEHRVLNMTGYFSDTAQYNKNLFLNQYKLTSDQLTEYKSFYEHKDTNRKVDWALVSAKTNIASDTPAYYEFGNRVLSTDNSGTPFAFNMGIFDVKRGRFVDLTESTAEDYDGMEAVWTELGSGRLLGDMDNDNELTVSDVTIIQRCQAEIMDYPEADSNPCFGLYQNSVAYFSDFDQDGERGIIDATMIQRFLADLPHRTAEYEPYVTPTEPFHPSSDPSIPTITGFRSVGKGIEISIGTVPGAEKYRLYFKNKNGNWEKMGETTGEPFISTNNIEVGKTYYYSVRCIKADLSAFTSDLDKTGWGYTYNPQLDTPKITRLESVDNGVKITWAPVKDADLYRVYFYYNNWTKLIDTRDTSYVHTEAYNYKDSVRYTVQCLSQGGKSAASEYDPRGRSYELNKDPSFSKIETHTDGIYLTLYSEGYMSDEKIAVYRKNGSSWKRIGVAASFETFVDKDVTAGKSYTYTCRCLSADGSYFISRFNKTGWTQSFTVDQCIPELEYIVNYGDGEVTMQTKQDCKFSIPKYAVMIYSGDEYIGACLLEDGEPGYFQDDFFKTHYSFTVYVLGLDKNEEPITSYAEEGLEVKMLEPADNLRVKYLGDRRYRIRWDRSPSSDAKIYAIDIFSGDDESLVFSDNIPYPYYDIDLGDYPEDVEWTALVWATTDDLISASAPLYLTFKESDYNSDTE